MPIASPRCALAVRSEGASTLKLETRLDLWASRRGRQAGGGSLAGGRRRACIPGLEAERLVAEIPLEARLDGSAPASPSAGARGLHLPGQHYCPVAQTSPAALELAYQPLALRAGCKRLRSDNSARQPQTRWPGPSEGPLDTTLERTSLKGRLSNGAGLAADIQLQRDAKTPWRSPPGWPRCSSAPAIRWLRPSPTGRGCSNWAMGERPPRPAGARCGGRLVPSTWT